MQFLSEEQKLGYIVKILKFASLLRYSVQIFFTEMELFLRILFYKHILVILFYMQAFKLYKDKLE
jgi:hypothetical protein